MFKKELEIKLLKLGGSVLTDKNKPFSIREDIITRSVKEIINSGERIILIHGGGSFGHPLAKKYHISEGFVTTEEDQHLGITKTHDAMTQLNSIIVQKFIDHNYSVYPIQASSIFIREKNNTITLSLQVIEILLKLGIMPILYGDVIFNTIGSFSIISGDEIILELCKNLKGNKIIKVLFAIEEDGLLVTDEDQSRHLITHINREELNDLILTNIDQKIDITGGISGKLEMIKKITELSIPVQIFNGCINGNLLKALKNQPLDSTHIQF